jgi:hypothetical protein
MSANMPGDWLSR